MERVAFLIESTGERISCLLNPSSVVVRRVAGVQVRESSSGRIAGAGFRDDPLIHTGGGSTELDLRLLFDTSVASTPNRSADVRTYTSKLWELAENRADDTRTFNAPPAVRFVWGRSWNIPGVVVAVAERLERFSAEGVPRRSWLSMRFRRVDRRESLAQPDDAALSSSAANLVAAAASSDDAVGDAPANTETATGDRVPVAAERLDELAYRHYQNPYLWRLIAHANRVGDPTRLAGGSVLSLPRLDEVGGTP